MAASLLPSRVPKRGRNCYITPTFSGVPSAKRGEKIRSGYLTPAFSGDQERAELLPNLYILRGLQRQARGQNQKCGSQYPQLEGPHQSVGVCIPNSRGHTKVWESVSPTQGATPRRGYVWAKCKILLPSAVHLEERLTVSQSVPEPASRQSDRYTQCGFFVSGRCGPKQQGGPLLQSESGRVVTQPTGIRVVAGSNPSPLLWRRRRRRR